MVAGTAVALAWIVARQRGLLQISMTLLLLRGQCVRGTCSLCLALFVQYQYTGKAPRHPWRVGEVQYRGASKPKLKSLACAWYRGSKSELVGGRKPLAIG